MISIIMEDKFNKFIALIISIILLFFSAFVWSVGWLAGIFFTIIPTIIILILLIIGITLFFLHKPNLLKLSSLLLSCLIIGAIVGSIYASLEEYFVINRANILIKSLSTYKIKMGHYPTNINKLVPNFLPDNFNFNNINYESYNGKHYKISTNTINCGKTFESEFNEWHHRPCP